MASTDFETIESGLLPMKRGRVLKTLADSTIRGVQDAIVELVTNSDDSYAREEQSGKKASGQIEIHISRARGGHCKKIEVVDCAEGMGFQTLKKAIEFSGETSGFKEGRTVRGFFGRGLKESIIALGKGKISTLHNGTLSRTEIYYDPKKRDAVYKLATPIKGIQIEELQKLGFIGKSGTIVEIEVTNEKKDKIPSYSTIEEHITNHYALRDVCSSSKRTLTLQFEELYSRGKHGPVFTSSQLRYSKPKGQLIIDEDVKLNGGKVHLRIFESQTQLSSPRNPQGTAGLIVKTEGAILDNKLFGYDSDPAALYFFGKVICPGIAKIIRNGDETIVDFNRGGLDWRHEYNKKLEKKASEILSTLVTKKRKDLKSDKVQKVAVPVQRMLEKLCKELSKLAKDELEESGPGAGETVNLMILPMYANIEPGVPRPLGVYVPKYLSESEGTKIAKLSSSNQDIKIINPKVTLDYYKVDPNVLKTTFKVVGYSEGESTTITAKLGSLTATSEVRVGPLKKKKKRKKKRRTGGLFSKILPAKDEDPIQRFQYLEGGIIKIFVKFPGIEKYLGPNFENVESPEGKAILSDVVIEAFCRHLAMQRAGKYFDEEIDPLLHDMDRLRGKASRIVYDIIFRADLKDLIKS